MAIGHMENVPVGVANTINTFLSQCHINKHFDSDTLELLADCQTHKNPPPPPQTDQDSLKAIQSSLLSLTKVVNGL